MEIMVIANQLIELFCMMGLGYLLMKINYLDVNVNKKISNLVISVTTPALIFASVFKENEASQSAVIMMLGIAFLVYLILPVVAMLFNTLLKIPTSQRKLYQFMTVFSNTGFMGYPVVASLYGNTGVFYAAIFNLMFNLFVFTYGIYLMQENRRLDWHSLFTPGIVLSLFAMIAYFVKLSIPMVIVNVCESVGGMTTPLAMLLIGASLSNVSSKEILSDTTIYFYTLLRQFLLPLLFFPLLRLVLHDELIRGVVMMMIAMPVGSISVLFATQYGNDSTLASKNVFVTTLCSLLSIPIITFLLSL